MRKLPPPAIAAKLAEVLRLVRLEGLAERLPRELSGGQQQRVALARALVIEPDILLLDEPLSNLDAKLRQEVRVEIRELQRKLGLTTVMVTHDQEEALTMADRLVVMSNGEVQQIGSQRDLYEQPGQCLRRGLRRPHEFPRRPRRSAGPVPHAQRPRDPLPRRRRRRRPDAGAAARAAVARRRCRSPAPTIAFPATVEFASYLGGILEYYVRLTPQDRLLVQAPNTSPIRRTRSAIASICTGRPQASLVLADDGGGTG